MSETGPRVLVVDDEPAIRRFLRVSLCGARLYRPGSGQWPGGFVVCGLRPSGPGHPGSGAARPRRIEVTRLLRNGRIFHYHLVGAWAGIGEGCRASTLVPMIM